MDKNIEVDNKKHDSNEEKNKIILKIFVIEIVILSYKFIEIYRKYWFNIGCINQLIIQLDKK